MNKQAKILGFVKNMLMDIEIPKQQKIMGITLDLEGEIAFRLSLLNEKKLDKLILNTWKFTQDIIKDVR